ncbi:MAG: regulatory protein RecX [Atribacterota bacterium]|nr:regulatory protein RecX [Atribacterota bacterium]MDD4895413.1 regulatory protein RecX [Atribacterota bacterium]MDD5636279.1 regulatory protein RecX [Atribacterota bacterium]
MNNNYQITNIKVKKNNIYRVKIYINNEFFAEIDSSIINDLDLYISKTVSQNILDIIQQKCKLSEAKNEAIRFLSYRPRSKWEVKKKLRDKKYQLNTINDVINWLKYENLIDDREFSIQWIKYQINKKPAGKIKLRNELYKKGVKREIIDNVINSFFEQDECELSLAYKLIRKKRNSLQAKNIKIEPQKIINLLRSQGFSNPIIQQVYNEFINGENTEP